MRKLSKKEYVVAGLLTFVALSPLGTNLAVNMVGSAVTPPTHAEWMEQRRQIFNLRKDCYDEKTGTSATLCDSVRLRGAHNITESNDVTESDTSDRPDADTQLKRALIRRAKNVGYCNERIKKVVPGLYALCVRALDDAGIDQ